MNLHFLSNSDKWRLFTETVTVKNNSLFPKYFHQLCSRNLLVMQRCFSSASAYLENIICIRWKPQNPSLLIWKFLLKAKLGSHFLFSLSKIFTKQMLMPSSTPKTLYHTNHENGRNSMWCLGVWRKVVWTSGGLDARYHREQLQVNYLVANSDFYCIFQDSELVC